MAQRWAVNFDKIWLCRNGTEICSSLASCTSERLRWVRKQMCGISVLTQVSMKCCSLSTRLHHQKRCLTYSELKIRVTIISPRTFFMSVLFIFRRKVMNKLIKTSPTTKQSSPSHFLYMGKIEIHHTHCHMYVVWDVYSDHVWGGGGVLDRSSPLPAWGSGYVTDLTKDQLLRWAQLADGSGGWLRADSGPVFKFAHKKNNDI